MRLRRASRELREPRLDRREAAAAREREQVHRAAVLVAADLDARGCRPRDSPSPRTCRDRSARTRRRRAPRARGDRAAGSVPSEQVEWQCSSKRIARTVAEVYRARMREPRRAARSPRAGDRAHLRGLRADLDRRRRPRSPARSRTPPRAPSPSSISSWRISRRSAAPRAAVDRARRRRRRTRSTIRRADEKRCARSWARSSARGRVDVPRRLTTRVFWGSARARLSRGIDRARHRASLDVRVTMGSLELILPPSLAIDVDVVVDHGLRRGAPPRAASSPIRRGRCSA